MASSSRPASAVVRARGGRTAFACGGLASLATLRGTSPHASASASAWRSTARICPIARGEYGVPRRVTSRPFASRKVCTCSGVSFARACRPRLGMR